MCGNLRRAIPPARSSCGPLGTACRLDIAGDLLDELALCREGALLTVLVGVLDEGLEPVDAVARPRFHPVGQLANAEPGLEPEALEALRSRGFEVRAWESRHHYFGGVSLITRSGGAGDPRRDGAAAPAAVK